MELFCFSTSLKSYKEISVVITKFYTMYTVAIMDQLTLVEPTINQYNKIKLCLLDHNLTSKTNSNHHYSKTTSYSFGIVHSDNVHLCLEPLQKRSQERDKQRIYTSTCFRTSIAWPYFGIGSLSILPPSPEKEKTLMAQKELYNTVSDGLVPILDTKGIKVSTIVHTSQFWGQYWYFVRKVILKKLTMLILINFAVYNCNYFVRNNELSCRI